MGEAMDSRTLNDVWDTLPREVQEALAHAFNGSMRAGVALERAKADVVRSVASALDAAVANERRNPQLSEADDALRRVGAGIIAAGAARPADNYGPVFINERVIDRAHELCNEWKGWPK